MLLEELLDVDLLVSHVANGLVATQSHPQYPLAIYNYTPATQFSRTWDAVTMQCRGLVVDVTTDEIVARPFPKFFNLSEHPSADVVFSKPFTVFDKADGSLGILVEGYGEPFIATRGSFASEQAVWATEHFRANYADVTFGEGVTALYEIIYPENRIVVDYGDMRDLMLLAVMSNAEGTDLDTFTPLWPGPIVERLDPRGKHPRDVLDVLQREGAEGLVLRFDHKGGHVRVKIKQEDYVILHRAKFNSSLSKLRDAWIAGEADLYIAALPDEIHGEFKTHRDALDTDFAKVYAQVGADFQDVQARDLPTRKEIAEVVKQTPFPGFVFQMVDGRELKGLRNFVAERVKNATKT